MDLTEACKMKLTSTEESRSWSLRETETKKGEMLKGAFEIKFGIK